MTQQENNRDIEQPLENLLKNTEKPISNNTIETEITRFQHRVDAVYGNPRNQPIGKRRMYIRYAVAASVAILAAIGIFLFTQNNYTTTPQYNTAIISKATVPGQKLTFTLPDGSKVMLNANSQIEFPENFDENERQVTLTGEAYFDVIHDPEKPFVVITANLKTTDLGTTFNIKERNTNAKGFPLEETQITVASGTVKVERNETNLQIIQANQQITYNSHTQEFIKETVDASTKIAWTEKTIYFENTPWAEVQTTLENWYGVTIIPEKDMQAVTLSGEYHDMSLENVLQTLSHMLEVDYKINDKTVIIK